MKRQLRRMDTLRQEASVDPAEEITKIVDGWIMKIHNAIFNKEIVKPALASEKRGSINSRLFDEVPAPISRSSTLLLNDVLSQRKLSDSSDSSNPSSVDDDDDDDDAEDDYNKEDKDPFRLYYKPRSTGWLVRFMHSLALNEEGILKKKEVDKIVDLRSKYARAEFAANTETTLALSTLQAEVVEYLSDLEIKIHHRKSDHPRLSLLNSRNSMTFVRQPVVSLKGRILDLFTAERRRTRNIQHRHAYASFWHMYRISEQSKYLIPRGNGKRKSMDNKSAAPKNHSDDAKRTTAKPQLKVLRMLSMRNWPLEAHTAQPLPSNPNCLTNAPTTTTTQECCDVSIEEDDTLSLANSRMMHVCEDYPNGREIEKMPLGVKRKLHDKGLLGSQLWTKMMDSQSEATGRRAKTYSKLFTNTITNDVESALPAIFDKMGRHLMPSKSDIPHSVTRSASTGALEMSSPRRDPSRWKEFTTVAPRIDISLEKSVTQEFKYPGCVAFFEAVKDRGIPPTPLPILAGTQEINDLVLSYRGLSDQELEAVVTGAVEIRSQPLKRLVLSGNSITDRGFLFLLDRFEHAGWLDVVESIDLGDNSGIGTDTIRAIGRLLHSNLVPRLMILKLSDITITDYAYALLSQQLHNETIEELDLSYTGLGRWSIQGPICVAEMIVHLKNLKSLNISGNHLNHSAMVHIGTALTKAGKLTSLSCSNNSGQLSHSFGSHFARSGYLGKAGMVALEDSVGREALDRCFPCMNILCSYLGSIPTLEYVDLCNSQLNHQSAFVLADSLCFHLNIRTLILSNNPMGPDGIRALLKIMYLNPFPSDRKMHSIALDRCEDSTMDDTALGGSVGGSPDGGAEYNFLDPTGSYRLHVENPYYRAVVRQCLRRWQLIQDSTSFSETFYDIRHNGSPIASFELDDKNVWHLPTQGMLTYTAVYRQKASEAALDPGTLNDDLGRAARETLSDDLFQRLIRW